MNWIKSHIIKLVNEILSIELKFKILSAIIFFIFLLVIFNLALYRYTIDIKQPFPEIENGIVFSDSSTDKPTIYFGVISRFPPNIIYDGYQPIMDFLTEKTQYNFVLKLSNSYSETVEQLINNETSVAFLGSFIYLQKRGNNEIIPILKPLNNSGKPYFHSVLITQSDSEIFSVEDLENKKLALPSKGALSGNWLTRYKMKKLNFDVELLDSIHHFAHHHTVVHQLIRNNFDAGVVKDRVAREYKDDGIRIIDYSMPIPGSPIVVGADIDKEVKEAIISAFLSIDLSKEEYREIVKDWDKEFLYGFASAKPSDYDQLYNLLKKVGILR